MINIYDRLGQLTSKEVGGDGMNRLQNVDYKYNIHGWLTDINNVDPLRRRLLPPTESNNTLIH